MFTFRGDEKDSSAGSITVEGTVEVHDLVLGSSVGRRVLDLDPLGDILHNKDANDRVVKWSIELDAFTIEFTPRSTIKSQALADFIAE